MLFYATGSTTSMAWSGCCRAWPEVMGWPKAYLNCWINWFHRNTGKDLTEESWMNVLVLMVLVAVQIMLVLDISNFSELVHMHLFETIEISSFMLL